MLISADRLLHMRLKGWRAGWGTSRPFGTACIIGNLAALSLTHPPPPSLCRFVPLAAGWAAPDLHLDQGRAGEGEQGGGQHQVGGGGALRGSGARVWAAALLMGAG